MEDSNKGHVIESQVPEPGLRRSAQLPDEEDLAELNESAALEEILGPDHLPLQVGEVLEIISLCERSIPGPLVTDDVTNGEGVPVANLPDGRCIVSLGMPLGAQISADTSQANVELICRARTLLLRLLAERERLRNQCDQLLEQIDQPAEVHDPSATDEASPAPAPRSRPR